MKNFESWREDIERRIEIQKSKGRKIAIYLISEEMSAGIASAIYEYFSRDYSVEKKQCQSCGGKKWDIIITGK